jgi:hypothetical protein
VFDVDTRACACSYWTAFGCFSVVEAATDRILFWFPYYYATKLAFLVWLQHPQTEGGKWLYVNVIKPLLLKHRGALENALQQAKARATRVADRVVADLARQGSTLGAVANDIIRDRVAEALEEHVTNAMPGTPQAPSRGR